jgi:hypothetical protein
MDSERQSRESRSEAIRRRLDAIHVRIGELDRAQKGERDKNSGLLGLAERGSDAQGHARESEAAAERAAISCVAAYLHAAEAHERAAATHQQLAAAGFGDLARHRQRAAFHLAGAAADRQRANAARSLIPGRSLPT